MVRPSNPHVVLRTLAVLAFVVGVPFMSACDKDDGDGADSADGGEESGEESGEDGSGEDGDGDGGTGVDGTLCERNPQGDVYSVGLTKEGELVKVTFVDANPAPPAKGFNRWFLMFTDLNDEPLTDVDISASPFMPAHQHGSPNEVDVSPGEMDGEYVLDPVDLFMAGLWEVNIKVALDESTEDSVKFEFCIDP